MAVDFGHSGFHVIPKHFGHLATWVQNNERFPKQIRSTSVFRFLVFRFVGFGRVLDLPWEGDKAFGSDTDFQNVKKTLDKNPKNQQQKQKNQRFQD